MEPETQLTTLDADLQAFRLMQQIVELRNQLTAERAVNQMMCRSLIETEAISESRREAVVALETEVAQLTARIEAHAAKARKVVHYCRSIYWKRGNPAAFILE